MPRGAKQVVDKKECVKCKRSYVLDKFYQANNALIFPDGRVNVCKPCTISYIEEHGTTAMMEILRAINKPFIYSIFSKNNSFTDLITQINSLPQHRDKTWEHSEFDDGKQEFISPTTEKQEPIEQQDNNKQWSQKWLGEYTKSEVSYLDSYLRNLHNDFKITTENHKDYARKIAKASLHMDKCFQDVLAGVTGADKRYKEAKDIFDSLSKSANFAESGRGQNDVSLGAFGVTFDQVEQNQWVPKHMPMDEDAYDKMLRQFSTIRDSV